MAVEARAAEPREEYINRLPSNLYANTGGELICWREVTFLVLLPNDYRSSSRGQMNIC